MRKVADGDMTHLGILFERYQKKIYNYFLRLCQRQEIAQDLTQEVFYRILKYRHTYADRVPFAMWIFRIAHNVGRDHFNKQKGDQPLDEEMACTHQQDPLTGLAQGEDMDVLKQAFAKLSVEKREVLILSRFREMKYADIAEATGISVAAVKVRVHRALKDLRDGFQAVSKEQVS